MMWNWAHDCDSEKYIDKPGCLILPIIISCAKPGRRLYRPISRKTLMKTTLFWNVFRTYWSKSDVFIILAFYQYCTTERKLKLLCLRPQGYLLWDSRQLIWSKKRLTFKHKDHYAVHMCQHWSRMREIIKTFWEISNTRLIDIFTCPVIIHNSCNCLILHTSKKWSLCGLFYMKYLNYRVY